MEKGIRSFVAVEIPEAAVARIDPLLADLASLGRDLKVVRRENLHYTLKFLGDIRQEMIEPIGECMHSVSNLLGFRMMIGGIGAFPDARRPRVIWIGAKDGQDNMVRLAEDLDSALSSLGFAKERSHVPHLTLARSRSGRGPPGLAAYMENMKDVEIGTIAVDTLKLKKSVLTPGGPIYSDILETPCRSE